MIIDYVILCWQTCCSGGATLRSFARKWARNHGTAQWKWSDVAWAHWHCNWTNDTKCFMWQLRRWRWLVPKGVNEWMDYVIAFFFFIIQISSNLFFWLFSLLSVQVLACHRVCCLHDSLHFVSHCYVSCTHSAVYQWNIFWLNAAEVLILLPFEIWLLNTLQHVAFGAQRFATRPEL
jgi:hypothetical protein